MLLTKARANPRWLLLLPVLCLLWVNTHGSILLGLFVLAVELGWSLIPERFVQRIGGVNQSPHTGSLGLALLGSVLASCITPYGPGLLAYDAAVSRNGQIARYISEWNSPNFHSVVDVAPLLHSPGRAGAVHLDPAHRTPRGLARGCFSSSRRSQTQRLVVYLLVVAAGAAATLPTRAPWGATARRWAGGGLVVLAIVILAIPAVPAGQVASSQPVAAFNYLEAHPGRIFTQYTWGDYSVARHRATFVDGRTDLFEGKVLTEFMAVTNLTTNPDPVLSGSHVAYVVWAPHTPLALYLARDPRWHVVDRTSVALVFARR